jgi:hypothetical protein
VLVRFRVGIRVKIRVLVQLKATFWLFGI